MVVAHREQLWWLLAEAAQLEHMIMCEYLYAEFSLKDGSGDGLTAGQAEAVGRWRTTLREIAVEEMLHLALVSNLMTAIGAAPVFGRPNFPQRSGYFPAGVQLDLLPFGEQALRHFLFLERPEGMELHDARGFAPAAAGAVIITLLATGCGQTGGESWAGPYHGDGAHVAGQPPLAAKARLARSCILSGFPLWARCPRSGRAATVRAE